ncbi:mycothiol conjugate amidase Mca [Corynebacterium caspium]|uniref:mycothiol conjugate amidase Mca n=1 Tax=Corynebacterium caspium TaxID=234828 RepID=UPI00036037E9|nr:mycothiol conjugate amidase Mca [Corynebacterium caspium]WKD59558.1 Mycothiol S-conjugate amidase [Corynebacterium caspium DSM 44850]
MAQNTNKKTSIKGLRLLAVHAHPDDEASKGAATMAKYAAAGHHVQVVTCTGGERGSILNPELQVPGLITDITATRREEMAAAAAALGISHQWMGYEDSGLPPEDSADPLPAGSFARQDLLEVATHLIKIIREFKPHVIITYDENGGYPHPDHLMVHAISMIAWDKAGDPKFAPEAGPAWVPLKLYYTHGFVKQRLEALHQYLLSEGKPSPYTSMLQYWELFAGDIMGRVTTQVECAEFFPAREAALRAHATQIDPAGPFLAVPAEVQKRLWPTEEFELAKSRVPVGLPETDLFASIVGSFGPRDIL